MWVAVGVSVVGAVVADEANNAAMQQTQENASRRYDIQGSIAQNQMQEQAVFARDAMTDISLKFLKAKDTAKTAILESGTTGNSKKRILRNYDIQASKAKGKVAQDANTNVINIAQGMIAKKIDTEAVIASAEANKKSSLGILVDAGLAGVGTYQSMGGTFGGSKSLTAPQQAIVDFSNSGASAGDVANMGARWTKSGIFN